MNGVKPDPATRLLFDCEKQVMQAFWWVDSKAKGTLNTEKFLAIKNIINPFKNKYSAIRA